MSEDKTTTERLLRRLKDHPIVAVAILVTVVVTGLATLSDSVQRLVSLWPGAPQPLSSDSSQPIRESSAYELSNHLRDLPPLQRESLVASEYIGRSVTWQGNVAELTSLHSGFLVAVYDLDHVEVLTFVRFDARARPILEALRIGDIVEYQGTIAEMRGVNAIVDGQSIRRVPDPSAD